MRILSIFLFLSFTLFATTRIMPLGDSITYDDAYRDYPELGGTTARPASLRYAYRSFLWYKLTDAGYNVNFVGSRSAGSAIRPSFDPDNEGYPGKTSAYIASRVYNFLRNNPADIILLHIGSNDWSSNVSSVNDILDEVDRYESNYHRHVKVILARIINRREYEPIRHQFNINLQSLANNRISSGDDIYVVDMEYGAGLYYDSRDFQDRTHPNDSGYKKMATVWFNALKKFIDNGPPPPPPIPPKPTNFIAAHTTSNSVTIQWKDNSENETVFKINNGSTPIARPGNNTTEYTITDLLPDKTYTFSLRACNDNGCSEAQFITITTMPPPIPTKPTYFKATNITSTSVTLQWKDNSENETVFKINNGATPIARPSSNATQYTITELEPRKTYTFHLRACNNNGCSGAQYTTFTTKDDYAWLPAVYHVILY